MLREGFIKRRKKIENFPYCRKAYKIMGFFFYYLIYWV